MFNNPWLYPYSTTSQAYNTFSVFPVGKIEEVNSIFPDLQGKPLFFFDQSRNEFFVKQTNVETGEVQILRYTLSNEPVKTTPDKDSKYYDEQIEQLKSEIERLGSIISVGAKTRKVTNNDEQSE